MQIYEAGLVSGRQSFPQARQSRALDAEDAFMQEHGGWGARLIYEVTTGLWCVLSGAWWPRRFRQRRVASQCSCPVPQRS